MSDLMTLWKSRVGAILGIVRAGGTEHREVAMRANDYRTAAGEGHRQLVFQLLTHTSGIDSSVALALDRAHRKRNELEYSGAVDVTEAETGSLIAAARALQESVLDWIKSHRPELGGRPPDTGSR